MKNKIVITGPTGNVGHEVYKLLIAGGHSVVAAAYRVDSARSLLGEAATIAPFDFRRPETFGIFDGATHLFLIRPPDVSQAKRDIAPAIQAAKAAGVRHVVFLSLLGVERNRVVPHRAIEDLIRKAGLTFTFLRASFFMQNLNTTHRDDIRERNDVFVPAGEGKTSFIDVRDIAAVGAKALTEPGHENQAYALTGADALDYAQVAQMLAEELGRPIRYSNPSPRKFGGEMRKRGLPLSFILVMNGIYTICRLGGAGEVTDECERLLGRQPITMRQYIRDYRASWI